MKRSPLKRKTGLKRSRKSRPISPLQMFELTQRVMLRDGRCVAADHDSAMCDGPTDAAHLIPQKTLKHFYVPNDPVFRDDRNVVALCRSHHSLMDAGFLRLPDELLPIGFVPFLREFGLEAEYDAMLARRVGA